jgi:hypothetical protein
VQIISTMSAISGKLGGFVASHGRVGPQLRAHTMRTQPRSPSQQANRRLLPSLTSSWRQLTPAQKACWAGLAYQTDSHDRLGQAHHPSAYTLFVGCNRNLQSIGTKQILATAPIKPTIPAVLAFTAMAIYDPMSPSPLLSGFQLNYQLSAATTAQALLKATPAVSLGRGNIRPSEYRILESFAAASPPAAPLYTLWTTKFGSFPTSGQVAFMLKLIDPASGFAGPPVTAVADFASAAAQTQPSGTIGIYVGADTIAFAPYSVIDVGSDTVGVQKP